MVGLQHFLYCSPTTQGRKRRLVNSLNNLTCTEKVFLLSYEIAHDLDTTRTFKFDECLCMFLHLYLAR